MSLGFEDKELKSDMVNIGGIMMPKWFPVPEHWKCVTCLEWPCICARGEEPRIMLNKLTWNTVPRDGDLRFIRTPVGDIKILPGSPLTQQALDNRCRACNTIPCICAKAAPPVETK
jgi:hypothetical protein